MFQPQIFRYGSLMDQWADFEDLRRNVNRLLSTLPFATDFPPVNIWVGQCDAVLMTELPGIDPQKLDISVVNDILKITGSRESKMAEEGAHIYRQERKSGPFTKTLQLPFQVDASKVEAKYEKGILQIILPRAAEEKPMKIAVRKD